MFQNHGGLTVVSMFRFDVNIKELCVQIVLQFVLIEHDDVQSINIDIRDGIIIRHIFEKRFVFICFCFILFLVFFFSLKYNKQCSFGILWDSHIFFIKFSALF